MLLTAAIVIPRSLSVAHAHSESFDDQYHLAHGLSRWTGEEFRTTYNDPPLGEMILALPLWVSGCTLEATRHDPSVITHNADYYRTVLYGQPYSPATLLMLVSGWKAILFLPGAGVVFAWCWRLYGQPAAWLTLAAVLAEPTIAAHTSVIALDVFSAEAIIISSYLSWRYFESPARWRLVAACAAVAAAMLIKLTAIIVLPVFILYAILHWWIRSRWNAELQLRERPSRRRDMSLAILLLPLFIWAFTLFDFSPPSAHSPVMGANYTEHWSFAADVVNANASRRWPAGIYIASLVCGLVHSAEGHPAFLLGEYSMKGWWYYQAIAAALKVPVGMLAILLLGFVFIFKKRIRFEEFSLLIPAALAVLSLGVSHVSIGFRHAIPAYILLLMLAGRCLQWPPSRWTRIVAGLCVAFTFLQGMKWHPDELSFINLPWRRPAGIISDSNIDWGQSLKQIRDWLVEHPQDRPVYLAYFGTDTSGVALDYYLKGRAQLLLGAPPEHGLLIVSPVLEYLDESSPPRFAKVRDQEPIAIIGHCMRVYDLDGIR